MGTDSGQVTQLLKAMRAGDPQAAQDLLPFEPTRRSASQTRRGRQVVTLSERCCYIVPGKSHYRYVWSAALSQAKSEISS